MRHEHVHAAQALASAAFTSTAHHPFQTRRLAAVTKAATRSTEPEDVAMGSVRFGILCIAVVAALGDFDPVTGLAARAGFNRHATAHRIVDAQ